MLSVSGHVKSELFQVSHEFCSQGSGITTNDYIWGISSYYTKASRVTA